LKKKSIYLIEVDKYWLRENQEDLCLLQRDMNGFRIVYTVSFAVKFNRRPAIFLQGSGRQTWRV
jgi:hypothetical protein